MNNSSRLIFILLIIFGLPSCKTFSPQYQIKEHPLIDRIWSVNEQKFVTVDVLKARILEADALLLGETHDNARHHQLQGLFIEYLIDNGRSPAVAYEMLNKNQQEVINQFQKTDNNTDKFAQAIDWENSGWPEWAYYRPAFSPTIENNLPIIAANLELKFIRKVIKEGAEALDLQMQAQLKKYQYDQSTKQALEQDILSAHCDMLPETMLSPMLLGQQVRDLSFTQVILEELTKPDNHGIVLIAGSGHTRKDYGVPYYLRQEAADKKVVSIAFIEVQEDEFKVHDYAQSWSLPGQTEQELPFDYVWFTPLAKREDPCEQMKAHMKKKKS